MSIKLLSLFHAFGESDSKILGSVEIINSQLIGTGACLPDFVLTNAMLEHMVDTNDEWIVQRTGVRERRIAKNMHTWELALGAAQDALADAKIDAGELDLILVSTCTPDTNTPNSAAILQDKLGAGAIGAFDINNACTGFVSATDIADCYIKSGKARTVLVVSAETLSRIVDYTDRGTCILFGDGAGAVVLEWRDEAETGAAGADGAAGAAGADAPGILSSYMENTDDVDRTLWCDSAFASRKVPFAADGTTAAAGTSATAAPRLAASDAESDPYMRMAGQAVFKFATSAMMRCTEEALTRAGLTTDDVTLFTPHQANERIIRYAAKKMGLPMERFQVIIDHVGNVSGASALIALNEAL